MKIGYVFAVGLVFFLGGCANKYAPLKTDAAQYVSVNVLRQSGDASRLIERLDLDSPMVKAKVVYDPERRIFEVAESGSFLSTEAMTMASVALERYDFLTERNFERCRRNMCDANQFVGEDLPSVTWSARDLLISALVSPGLSDERLIGYLQEIEDFVRLFHREYHRGRL